MLLQAHNTKEAAFVKADQASDKVRDDYSNARTLLFAVWLSYPGPVADADADVLGRHTSSASAEPRRWTRRAQRWRTRLHPTRRFLVNVLEDAAPLFTRMAQRPSTLRSASCSHRVLARHCALRAFLV